MQTGKITDLPNKEYHACEAVSHSRLEVFRKRPLLYYKKYIAKTIKSERTNSFDFGTAAHALVLEGQEIYNAQTAIWYGGPKNKARIQWENFQAEHADKLILTGDEDIAIFNVQEAIQQNPLANQLFYSPGCEVEVSWRIQPKGLPLPLQCRTDCFNPKGCALTQGRPYIADFKTTPSLNEDEYRNFADNFVGYGYHRQAGFYTPLLRDLGLDVCDFFFVAAEKCEPFGIDVYHLTQNALMAGVAETVFDLKQLAECYAKNQWPNRSQAVIQIDIPSWYLKKNPTPLLTP